MMKLNSRWWMALAENARRPLAIGALGVHGLKVAASLVETTFNNLERQIQVRVGKSIK